MQSQDKGKYVTAAILVMIVVALFLWTFKMKW
jgi:hypothetical protein